MPELKARFGKDYIKSSVTIDGQDVSAAVMSYGMVAHEHPRLWIEYHLPIDVRLDVVPRQTRAVKLDLRKAKFHHDGDALEISLYVSDLVKRDLVRVADDAA